VDTKIPFFYNKIKPLVYQSEDSLRRHSDTILKNSELQTFTFTVRRRSGLPKLPSWSRTWVTL